MFSKLALLVAATMAIFVAAAPADGGINNSCNTGPVQCCNELYDSDSAKAKSYLFSLGLINVVAPISTKVGANCSPLSVIGLGKGSSCKSQPVCCNDNKFGGLIAIGCSPVNINL